MRKRVVAAARAAAWVGAAAPAVLGVAAAGSAARAATWETLWVDATVNSYDLTEGVTLKPLSASVANPGFAPNDFGGNDFQEGQWVGDDEAAGWSGSDTQLLSDLYFRNSGIELGLDINQTGHTRRMGLSKLRVEISGQLLWEMDAAAFGISELFVFNDTTGCGGDGLQACPNTVKANANGVDAIFVIPYSLVVSQFGNGAIDGSDSLTLKWVQTNTDASDEQWELLRSTAGAPLDGPITYSPIPLPAGLALLPAGLAAFGLVRRRRA